MNITKYLLAICVVCCAATTSVSAYQRDYTRGISREMSKGFDKIVELMNKDSDQESFIKEMAILAFEKKIAKQIERKQKGINNRLENIDEHREDLKKIRAGEWDSWFEHEEGSIAQRRQDLENNYLTKIDKRLAEIADLEKEIAQYTEFQNKIQAWKNKG